MNEELEHWKEDTENTIGRMLQYIRTFCTSLCTKTFASHLTDYSTVLFSEGKCCFNREEYSFVSLR